MTIERIARTIPATGFITTGVNNFSLFLTSNAAVTLRAERSGTAEIFSGITGGLLLKRVKPWGDLRIVGAAGTSVEILVGTEEVEKDETDIRLQIATIAGVASFAEFPSATIATPDDNALPAATTENIAANPLRRRITIGCLSSNTVGFRVQAVGANDASGLEVQPGTFVELKTTASIDVRNNDGAVATSYYIFEET